MINVITQLLKKNILRSISNSTMMDSGTSVINVILHLNVLHHWQTITIVLIKVYSTNVTSVTTNVATGQTLRSIIWQSMKWSDIPVINVNITLKIKVF